MTKCLYRVAINIAAGMSQRKLAYRCCDLCFVAIYSALFLIACSQGALAQQGADDPGDAVWTQSFLPEPSASAMAVDALTDGERKSSSSIAGNGMDNSQFDLGLGAPARIRGLVVPRFQPTISSRLQATILRIGPDNGERFIKGDILVEFDCETFRAELNRAEAQAEAAGDAHAVKKTLADSGSISRLQEVLARSELKRAAADVLVARQRARQCVIHAPFDGRVVRRIANAHETLNFRDPLLEIVSDADTEVRVFVPSNWIGRMAIGSRFSFLVDETGELMSARIIAVGARIDNVSQLLEIRGRLETRASALIAGMSGHAIFDPETETAALVAAAAAAVEKPPRGPLAEFEGPDDN